MFKKLAVLAVVGGALFSAASAYAQIPGVGVGDGPPPPGYGRQLPPPPPQGDFQAPPRYRQPPAQARPYDYRGRDDGWDRRPRYGDDWNRRPRYGYDEPAPYRPRGRFGDYCATSRGACQTRPQPVGSSCRCDIDGLIKRGIIQ